VIVRSKLVRTSVYIESLVPITVTSPHIVTILQISPHCSGLLTPLARWSYTGQHLYSALLPLDGAGALGGVPWELTPSRGEGTFEQWVCHAVHRCHSREGGWDTGVGRASSI